MAMNAAEGREMLAASRTAPGLVAQLVPAPHTLEVDRVLTKLLAEGYAGEVHAVDVQGTQQGRFAELGDAMHWRQDRRLSGNNILNMGIWYEAMMRWLGPARRVTAMTKIARPKRKDETGAWHEVTVPDHVDILATFKDNAVAHLRFSSLTAFAPPPEAWIFGSDGTLRLEVDARRLSGARRGDSALAEIVIPADQRIGWRVEEEFVNAIRGRETITHTSFEDGVRYMEFTDAVARSYASGQAVEVKDL
jgi:predicted dehydrogenase